MEELLLLIRNLSIDSSYQLTMCSFTKINCLQHVFMCRDNREYQEKGSECVIRIEVSKRNEEQLNQCFAHLIFNNVFRENEELRSTIALMDESGQKAIKTASVETLKIIMHYDLLGYFPWITDYPHIYSKGKFNLYNGDKEVNLERKFLAQKLAILLNVCYNNNNSSDNSEQNELVKQIGQPLGWCDQEWLLQHFTIYEFSMIMVESMSLDIETIQWVATPENKDELFFIVTAHYIMKCYHNVTYPKKNARTNKKCQFETKIQLAQVNTQSEYYKVVNGGESSFDMSINLIFKVPKSVLLEKYLYWNKEQQINFFL